LNCCTGDTKRYPTRVDSGKKKKTFVSQREKKLLCIRGLKPRSEWRVHSTKVNVGAGDAKGTREETGKGDDDGARGARGARGVKREASQ
jgi:hypothetical protein